MSKYQSRPIVLTIDDEKPVRASFRYFLEDHGYRILEAKNGREGLEVFEHNHIDLILVDLRMPEVDGLDVLAKIVSTSPNTPVIVVSGTGVIDDVVEALHLGAWDYLLKPILDMNVLRHAVEKSLDRSRLLKENSEYQQHLELEVERRTEELKNETLRATSAAAALTESEGKVRLLLDSTAEAIFGLDLDGKCSFCNPACLKILGYSDSSQLLGKDMNVLILGQVEGYSSSQLILNYDKESETHSDELSFQKSNGSWFPVEYWSHPIIQEQNSVGWVVTFLDVTERKKAEAQIEYLAYHDELTNLPNRRLLLERLKRELGINRRRNVQGALIYLDLDHFKNLNDALGHKNGDLLLCQVAERMIGQLRAEDTVARLGGDEFVVMLPELRQDVEAAGYEASIVAEKLRQALSQPYLIQGNEYHFTSSIGIALFPEDGDTVEDVLKHADSAMYRAKAEGRNSVRFFLPSMQDFANERLSLEKDLRLALARDELLLYYQPQIDEDGNIIGVEALVRWQQPERGFVMPDQFIPVAEESGIIIDVGAWVFKQALFQVKQWYTQGLCELDNFICVNVSARQFRQPAFLHQIESALDETDVPPGCVSLELTESIVMHDVEEAIENMRSLKSLGIHLTIDDFGTGYSSLAYLKRFPLDEIKIDKSFVRDIPDSANDAAIVETIIAMSEHLSLSVVAEGVETENAYNYLKERGCRRFQGNLFSKPLPADEMADLLRQQNIWDQGDSLQSTPGVGDRTANANG